MRKKNIPFVILLFLFFLPFYLGGESRFPRPEFRNEYTLPETAALSPDRAFFWEWIDLALLLGAMGLASWLGLKKRSRKGLFFLSLFSLAYFGFWRQGCVCPVGALQNVISALTDKSYVIPLTAVLFFLFPLLFALARGRVFCSSVCPLGVVQDLVNIKPLKLPLWLEKILGLFPLLYLSLAFLGAATKAGFFICQYDPFVGFFRFGAAPGLFLLGGIFLAAGIFIGRPYCRFFCSYGVLLGWASRLSARHLTITPDDCINCGFCSSSCPFGAIEAPTPEVSREEEGKDKRLLGLLLLLLPVLGLLAGFLAREASPFLARLHKAVRLEEELLADPPPGEYSLEMEAFYEQGSSLEALRTRAAEVRKNFRFWSSILGIFIGLALGVKLIELLRRPRRREYSIRREHCFSCGRCLEYCPRDKKNFIPPEKTKP